MSVQAARCPYVGLVPYSEEDWEFFFGRETETELIIANLQAARLTLLFGASGVGKSSVLRAGVAHQLALQARRNRAISGVPEVALAVFGAWRDDPLAGLTRAVHDSVARTLGSDPGSSRPGEPLADVFAGWAEKVGGEILVVLDQFEEYFLYHAREDGDGTFAVEFPKLVKHPGLRVNFLVAIREDAVARLDRFKGQIPNLFDNYLRLQHLDLKAAEDAIRLPLDAFNRQNRGRPPVVIEPALVEAVLNQTRTGQVRGARSTPLAVDTAGSEAGGARIETPYLQMVMTRLWDAEENAGSSTLRLVTFVEPPPKGLGGANRIVRTHLDNAMAALDPAEQDVAAQAFRFLVTRSGTKIALAMEDLAGYTSLPVETLTPVLTKLAGGTQRILRPVPVPDVPEATRYEIFHDVLGQAITDWRGRHEAIREQEAIRREQEERRLKDLQTVEDKRQRERSRYLKISVLVLSVGFVALLGISWLALKQRAVAVEETARAHRAVAQERLALAQALDNAKTAEAAARAGITARAAQASRAEPRRAESGSELRNAFLGNDSDTVESTARRLGLLNEDARFAAQRVPQKYRIEQGEVFEFSMRPLPESVSGGLRTLAAVTFKMNHPTFQNKVIVGDPAHGFRASYIGWGCLSVVPVLLEYLDPGRPPQVSMFAMCANLETVNR